MLRFSEKIDQASKSPRIIPPIHPMRADRDRHERGMECEWTLPGSQPLPIEGRLLDQPARVSAAGRYGFWFVQQHRIATYIPSLVPRFDRTALCERISGQPPIGDLRNKSEIRSSHCTRATARPRDDSQHSIARHILFVLLLPGSETVRRTRVPHPQQSSLHFLKLQWGEALNAFIQNSRIRLGPRAPIDGRRRRCR